MQMGSDGRESSVPEGVMCLSTMLLFCILLLYTFAETCYVSLQVNHFTRWWRVFISCFFKYMLIDDVAYVARDGVPMSHLLVMLNTTHVGG